MTLKQFRKLKPRDFEKEAVRDELAKIIEQYNGILLSLQVAALTLDSIANVAKDQAKSALSAAKGGA